MPWQDGSTGLQHLHPQQPTTPPNGGGQSKWLSPSVDATTPMDRDRTRWLAKRASSQRGGRAPCQTRHCEHTQNTEHIHPGQRVPAIVALVAGDTDSPARHSLARVSIVQRHLGPLRRSFCVLQTQRQLTKAPCLPGRLFRRLRTTQRGSGKRSRMSRQQEASRHSLHELVTGPARCSEFCVHPPSRGGTTSPGRGALQPGRNSESARVHHHVGAGIPIPWSFVCFFAE